MNYGSISLQKSCIKNFRGIFANAFSQLLLEEGILEAPIFCGSRIGFFNHELRFQYDKAGRFKYRSFWTPSFLEESIWLLAATRFRPHMELRSCIRCCLLPVLPDPDAIYRYVTSSKPLESQFIEFGILETPIRVIGRKQELYYFDHSCVYRKSKLSGEYPCRTKSDWHTTLPSCSILITAWQMAVPHFMPGMVLAECLELFKEIRYRPVDPITVNYTEMERLVQKIETPRFERFPENPDPRTVDFIRVQVDLPCYLYPTHTELAAAVRAHKPEIDKLVVEKIESARAFRELGVPLGFFFLSECILRKNHTLEYIFELKHPSHSGAQGALQEK